MTPFCFIHAADLHLDSPFKGLTADAEQCPRIVEAVRDATFHAFDGLVNLCLQHHPLFVLLAGDVFDAGERSVRAQLRLRDGLARLAGMQPQPARAFIVHGNHDPLDGCLSAIAWPDNVHIFGDELETVSVARDEDIVATVSGVSYRTRRENRQLHRHFAKAREQPDAFRIGLLHCNVGSNPEHESYVPCESSDLLEHPIDYWALGHVHEHQTIRDTHPYVVYPGNTQGRHARELGPRGCYLVHVAEDRSARMQFVPLDAVRWCSTDLDVSDRGTIDAVDQSLVDHLHESVAAAEGRPVICRVRLTGRTGLFHELQDEAVRRELLDRGRRAGEEVEPFAWLESLEIVCRPEIDLDAQRQRHDLLGEVLRVAEELRQQPDGCGRVLNEALSELYGSPSFRGRLPELDEAQVAALLEEAEFLCADLLETSG